MKRADLKRTYYNMAFEDLIENINYWPMKYGDFLDIIKRLKK